VPRSMPTSRETKPNTESSNPRNPPSAVRPRAEL